MFIHFCVNNFIQQNENIKDQIIPVVLNILSSSKMALRKCDKNDLIFLALIAQQLGEDMLPQYFDGDEEMANKAFQNLEIILNNRII